MNRAKFVDKRFFLEKRCGFFKFRYVENALEPRGLDVGRGK
jgi:hypothetical protein